MGLTVPRVGGVGQWIPQSMFFMDPENVKRLNLREIWNF